MNSNILILVNAQRGFLNLDEFVGFEEKLSNWLSLNLFDVVIGTRFVNYDKSLIGKCLGIENMKSGVDTTIPGDLLKYIHATINNRGYHLVDASFLRTLQQFNGDDYPDVIFIAGVGIDNYITAIASDLLASNIRPIVLAKYSVSVKGKDGLNAGIDVLESLIGENQVYLNEVLSQDDLIKIKNNF